MNETKIQIRRYNIYSCLTIKTENMEICFDPAKIRDEDLKKINPDYIFKLYTYLNVRLKYILSMKEMYK